MYCSWLSIAPILKSKESQNPLFLHVLKNTLRWHKSENDSRLWQLELLSIFLWISEDNWVAMKWRLLGWWVWFTFSQLTLVHRVHLLLDAFWHRVFLQNQDHGLLRRHHHALFVVILTIGLLTHWIKWWQQSCLDRRSWEQSSTLEMLIPTQIPCILDLFWNHPSIQHLTVHLMYFQKLGLICRKSNSSIVSLDMECL